MNLPNRRSILMALAAIATAAFVPLPAQAQAGNWPNKTIKLIVGFTPGGSTDLAARILAQALSEQLGQPVVVENKAGASGNIATDFVAKAAPDGYTIMLCTIPTHAINPHLFKNLPYNHLKDFAPVSLVAMLPNIIAAHPDFPAGNVKELVVLLKKDPGKYNFAAVPGGSPHLTAEVFKETAGVQMQLVPYKGASPAITDVMAGHVPLVFENVAPTMAFIKSGKLKAIAVTNAPTALPGFVQLAGALLTKSELDPQLREMVILRVGAHCRSAYEIHQHRRLALHVGVSEARIERSMDLADAASGDGLEDRLLAFTDAVVRSVKAPAVQFEALREHLSPRGITELLMTIGTYMMVSRVLENLEVEIEQDGVDIAGQAYYPGPLKG